MEMTGEERIAAESRDGMGGAQRSRRAQAMHPRLRVAGEDIRYRHGRCGKAADRAGAGDFQGKVKLSDLDPPNGYRISGEGQGGVAGYAKGGAVVRSSRTGRARYSSTRPRPTSAASSRSSAGG